MVMDFLDPKKKKAHIRKLYIGYLLMAVAIGFGALILLYAAFGYGVDRRGNVFQNGLVFIASTPDGAQVQINNKAGDFERTAVTSDRLVLPGDEYHFEFLKQGYRLWQRTLTLRGGHVERLVYPFLFPDQLETSDVELYAKSPKFVTGSPDRSRIVVQKPGEFTSFDVFDANDPGKVPDSISVPSSLFKRAEKSRSLKLIEWSTDNRNFLVQYNYDGKKDFIIIDLEDPNSSLNIDKEFDLEPKDVKLRDKNPDLVYILMPSGRLHRGEIKNTSLERVASNVATFKPHGANSMLLINNKNSTKTKKVQVVFIDGGKEYTVRTLSSDKSYLIDLARFNDHWYIVAGAPKESHVYIYRDPMNFLRDENPRDAVIRTIRLDNPKHVSFSNNARFIAVQSGRNFVVYDAEDDLQYRYKHDKPLDGSDFATWMDGHRLMGISGKEVEIFDFNGDNNQTLNATDTGYVPLFDRDYTGLYTIAPSVDVSSRSALTRTELRTPEDR